MERVKAALKRMLFLPPLPAVLICVPSFALVICVLAADAEGPLAYAGYGLSAYALDVAAAGIVRGVRAVRGGIDNSALVKKVRAHPVGRRYLDDAAFRAGVSLYPSLCVNLFYAAFKLITGVLYASAWLITLAVYYALLAVMRFLALTSARKRGSPAQAASRAISLTAALVSMLALETAMISRFGGEEDALFRQVMLSVSGGAVCALVLGMAVYMMVRATKQIRVLKGADKDGRQERDLYL